MEILDKATLEKALRPLNAAIKGKKLYPDGHPAVNNPLKQSYDQITVILNTQDPILLGKIEDVLVFGHHSFLDKTFAEILEGLEKKKLEGLSFHKGLTFDEFLSFTELIFSESEYDIDELRRELLKNGISHISIKFLPIKNKFLEVYQTAVDTVKTVMDEVRLGTIPKTEMVMEVVEDLSKLVLEDRNAMMGLTMIKDYDNYLFTHSVNVSILSIAMADTMGIDKSTTHMIGVAALLHDIGKTGVGENIIKKPGRLSNDEWEKIKEHPEIGYQILSKMEGMPTLSPRIALEHHMRFDMTGYPKVSQWEKPHTYTMIVTLSDTYDAITTLRTYQKPLDPATAINKMKALEGSLLDPELLNVFTNMLGFYPVGSMVRLNTNEIALIVKANPEDNTKPVLRIIYNKEGKKLKKTRTLDLSKATSTQNDAVSIVAHINPITKNIKIENYFKEVSNF